MLFIRPAIRSAGRRFERLRCRTERKSRSIAPWIAAATGRRGSGRATGAARRSGRSRGRAARARWRRPRRAARDRMTAAVCGCSACRKLASAGVGVSFSRSQTERTSLRARPSIRRCDLVLVVEDGGEQLAGHLGAAGDLRAGGQQVEELDDHRVEQLLVDLAEAARGRGRSAPCRARRARAGSRRRARGRSRSGSSPPSRSAPASASGRSAGRRGFSGAAAWRGRGRRLRSWGVAPDHGAGEQGPAVGDDEEGELERQRDDGGRHHHHAHRHQDRGDDEVDDEEGQEDQEADLEAALDLGEQEGGDEGRRAAAGRSPARGLGRPRAACRRWRGRRGASMKPRNGAIVGAKASSGGRVPATIGCDAGVSRPR